MLAHLLRAFAVGVVLAVTAALAPARAADDYRPDPALLAAAQKEGEVLFYTTHIVDQIVRPLIKSFQTYVPGVDVKYVRGNGTALVVRLTNEARASRVLADVWCLVDGVAPIMQAGLIAPFELPSAKTYPLSWSTATAAGSPPTWASVPPPTTRNSSPRSTHRTATRTCSIRAGRARSSGTRCR